MEVVALAGGVGGAKLADGLQRAVGEDLTVLVNTGDDFELHGIYISPDLDTVMYTLAGIANPETGWGIAGDDFNSLEMMSRYGAESWFKLGDRDLATHILRSQMLREGRTLTQTTRRLAEALGVRAALVPMSDQRVRTVVDTDQGELTFQEYFVHRRWQPLVKSVRFLGIEEARPTVQVLNALDRADTIIFCPSNPFVSIEPILCVPGIRERIRKSGAAKIAVSPLVGGEAIRGPAAKIFRELGVEPTALAVAQRYAGLVNAFMIDRVDAREADSISALGMQVLVRETVMGTLADRERVGREIVNWATT
jgi:LPPG:FO 2-phospho-L-lactate transferase